MTIHDQLTPYEFLSQGYYAYFAHPIRSTVYLVTLIALLSSLCIFSFDVSVWVLLLAIAVLCIFYISYAYTMFILFKNSEGAVPIAFEMNDKKLVITYGSEDSRVLSGTSFKKGSSIWIQGHGLFIIRKPIIAGMLLPKGDGEKIKAALKKYGWITSRPASSILSTVGLVLFVVFACISIPFLALYS